MAKAESLIEMAATYAGIKAIGSSLDGETLSHGLSCLNSMLDSWQGDNLFIPYTTEVIQTISGSPVTIGSGQTINVARPKFIRDTSFMRVNNVDRPIFWLQQAEFNAIANKLQTSTTSVYGYYDEAFPIGRIYFYPVPGSVELHLQIDAVLPQFADYTTDYPIDTAYRKAIETSLAENMCIGMRDISSTLAREAAKARQIIRINNTRVGTLSLDYDLLKRGYYARY